MDIIQFLKDLFMLKHVPELGMNASYGLLFLLGLLTSFHCVGMCGGIVLSQTVSQNNSFGLDEEGKKKSWFIPSISYNFGRVIAYTFVGGVVGGLGQIISFSGVWKGVFPILGGLFMIIMGINLLGIFPTLRRFNIRMPYFAARKIKSSNNYTPFYIGLLTGLMPCGPLQIIQLYALGTRSVLYGALSMLVFSLGTVPMLFSLGALNTVITKKQSKQILKVSSIFIIILGFVMINRGFALSGMQSMPTMNSTMTISKDIGIAHIEGSNQIVSTSIKTDSFPPIIVQKGIPVKWTINVKAENINNCNKSMIIQTYKLQKDFSVGENLVEFTPESEGDIIYTCWMGMIKSKITVVDDLSKVNK